MRKVIIGIGIPGSGKSTLLQKFATKNKYVYVCPDDIREELTGDPQDQTQNAEVWQEAYKRAQEYLALGKSVVFDATFTYSPQRIEFIEFVREHGAQKVQGVYLDVDLETAKERNASRERVVPEHVLERMHASLGENAPQLSDGFDMLITLDEEQKLIDAERRSEGSTESTDFRSN